MAIFLNDWNSKYENYNDKHEFEAMLSDFEITADKVEGCEILLASYTYENYSGEAFVLFRKDGKLYEVNGSHCSCYGLGSQGYSGDNDTQWKPEETTLEALLHRLDKGRLGMDWETNTFASELREILNGLT